MNKVITGFFRFLCILLLSGLGQLSAHAYYQTPNLPSLKSGGLAHSGYSPTSSESGFTYHPTTSGTAKHSSQFEPAVVENKEEDETDSHKKHIDCSNSFIEVSFAQISGFHLQLQKTQPFVGFLDYSVSNKRFILYSVYRI